MKKKVLAMILATAMVLSLAACGGSKGSEDSKKAEDAKVEATTEPEKEAEVEATAEPEVTEEAPAGVEPTSIAIGDTIALDFVEITFAETGIAADIKQSITIGNATRITGPEPVDGQQYIYLRGTIKNLATEELPVFDFFVGEFKLDDYCYKVTANECTVIDANGSSENGVPPLATYTFTMYAAVPNELVDTYTTSNFRFGFYDMFDNQELARNKAFEEDPTSLCPYYYTMKLK